MPHFEVETPSPPSAGFTTFPSPGSVAALAALSRNASVISSSSGSSSSSSLLLNAVRPRPLRTFSSPRTRSPSGGSATPRAKVPPYLSKELLSERAAEKVTETNNDHTRKFVSKSRKNSSAGRLGPDDFEFGEVLGEGSYSTVMAAVYPPTRKAYAIKIIDKEPLVRNSLVWIANVEKNVLVKLAASGHPGLVRLHWAFQDEWSWYFVLDLLPQGDLQSQISHLGSISLPCARWYTAQIIDAAAWMHARGIIHRDLKPQNVLLDDHMRIKITDFGSARMSEVGQDNNSSNSWVGTPQYVPPELLFNNTMCRSSDFWAIGCILYQMISGKFPFQGASNYVMWVKVKTLDYSFPDGFDDTARDLVQKFLVLDPDARFGAGEPGKPNDLAALRAHLFFDSLSWDRLWRDQVPPIEVGITKKEGNLGPVSDEGHGSLSDVHENGYTLVESPDSHASYVDPGQMFPESPSPPPAGSDGTEPRHTPFSTSNAMPTESTAGRLGGILESLTLASRSRRPSTTSVISTPLSDPTCWMPFLRPSEAPVFFSRVHKVARRTFPRQLLPLTSNSKKGLSGPGKDRVTLRLLVLTRTRLLCFKEQDGGVMLKSEMLIGGQGGGIGVVTGVEKLDQAFVVQTVSKSYTYNTEDSALAVRWATEIGVALPSNPTTNTDL